MKKLVLMLAVAFSMSFVACNKEANTEAAAEEADARGAFYLVGRVTSDCTVVEGQEITVEIQGIIAGSDTDIE